MILNGATSAIWGLIGILLGGGLQSAREWSARHAEKRGMEAALAAEIAALLTTIEVRGLLSYLSHVREYIEQLLEAGESERPIFFPRVSATWNYFATYDALLPKIGLLSAHKARALTNFYVSARSSSEMMLRRPGSTQLPLPARQMIGHLLTEEKLIVRLVGIGHAILDGRWHDAGY